jgi:hypothetical protein
LLRCDRADYVILIPAIYLDPTHPVDVTGARKDRLGHRRLVLWLTVKALSR